MAAVVMFGVEFTPVVRSVGLATVNPEDFLSRGRSPSDCSLLRSNDQIESKGFHVPGLTDMEELVASVEDKEVANYLREALACYGTGAYRACIVLTHIALFEGMRRKVRALAPVNAIARSVSDAIEPLAESQKVFESPLVHKLKKASIITELEAQRLEQINDQRNKAAHPSGHEVTAEEARFVFAEAIKKYLSKPIRQTSYVVDHIITRIGEENFFPASNIDEMTAVVEHEVASLDALGFPFLIARLVEVWEGADPTASRHARFFFITLAAKADAGIRSSIIKCLIEPGAASQANGELFTELVSVDPSILQSLSAATKLLLVGHAKEVGVREPYRQYRNPLRVLVEICRVLGENFAFSEYSDLTSWIIGEAPTSPQFVGAIAKVSPRVFHQLWDKYLQAAGSADFATANAFANAVSQLDDVLSQVVTDSQSLSLFSAIVCSAEIGAFDAKALANSRFEKLPKLRSKAVAFALAEPDAANAVLASEFVPISSSDFITEYLQERTAAGSSVVEEAPEFPAS